ncbi:PAS domain S-box protein [Bacteroidota bacterium]
MIEFLIQSNPEPIFIYDKENLIFLEVNKAALELYGYSREEFLQMDVTDLYNPEDIQSLLGSPGEGEVDGKFSKPLRHKKKDGSSVFVELSKMRYKFDDKDSYFNIIRDVTQNLELKKNNQIFKAAFDNTVDMIFTTDPDGKITYVNSRVTDILGSSKLEFENTPITSLVNDEDSATINASIFESHIKEPVSVNVGLRTVDGSFIEVELAATPVDDIGGNLESFVIIGKVEQGISGGAGIREGIVEKSLTSSASETNQLESEFLSGVFHELLTPMNVILGFTQELTEGIENLTPDQKEAVKIIEQNRSKLLSTMNAVIESSEIQKNKDEWNIIPLNIIKVVEDIENDIFEITSSRTINFAYGKISTSLQFETDKRKFFCLVGNIIRMVCRIIKENKIYFSAHPVDGNNFMIVISDHYGSSSDHLEVTLRKLFVDKVDPKEVGISKLIAQITQSLLDMLQVKFVSSADEMGKPVSGFLFPIKFTPQLKKPIDKIKERVVKATEKKQIPVVPEKKVVQKKTPAHEDYGIIIEEETPVSEKKKNIEPKKSGHILDELKAPDSFSFPSDEPQPKDEINTKDDLPINELAKKKNQQPDDKLDLKHLTCLYIEDQVDSQILFKTQMKELKNIKFSVSFEEALPVLDTEQFDFIVMDINLQGEYNGLDALKIVHKMPGYEEIPIIAVTAYVLPGDKDKFIATGFNDFISKPIFREKLVKSLEKIFLQKA